MAETRDTRLLHAAELVQEAMDIIDTEIESTDKMIRRGDDRDEEERLTQLRTQMEDASDEASELIGMIMEVME